MADDSDKTGPAGDADQPDPADRVLEELAELEPELRAAAIIGADNTTRAVRSDDPGWGDDAIALLRAVDSAGDRTVDSAHIATEQAEVFVVREGELSLVAVTGRFVLASLTGFDMRMSLRDLAAEVGGA
ncbi:MAG: hypothetical protein JJE10_00015 [Thermoleophilia bacterium]|nr:hypothetical protein [Thermoleophilia bacterium]